MAVEWGRSDPEVRMRRPIVPAALVLPAWLLLVAPETRAQGFAVELDAEISLAVGCSEPSCDCTVDGAPDICPATNVRELHTGSLALPVTSDLYGSTVTGTLLPSFDSSSAAEVTTDGSAALGVLSGLVSARSDSPTTGYIAAGGLALGGTANSYLRLIWQDTLTVAGPPGPISLVFGYSVTSTHMLSVGAGSGPAECAATNVQIDFTAMASSGATSEIEQYGYSDTACVDPPQVIGSPAGTFPLTVNPGATVAVFQVITLLAAARADGGPGSPTRIFDSSALLDASSTARFFVEVLTPGASYTSASGTVYPTPEAQHGGAAAAVSALALLWRRRARRSGL